eukprot:GHVS01062017.1.p1 GENE.GHVS01062017.1~~GHVS01062017.1.p1  ORF type:complete len:519 (-),score=40.22 GHVS01062017.1:131-1687(-)
MAAIRHCGILVDRGGLAMVFGRLIAVVGLMVLSSEHDVGERSCSYLGGQIRLLLANGGVVPVPSEDPQKSSIEGPVPASLRDRVIVLGDTNAVRTDTHRGFIEMLTGKGFKVSFREFGDAAAKLVEFGEYLFDYAVILDSSPIGSNPAEGGQFKGISLYQFLQFVDDGGSVILATGPSAGGTIRKFANEVGLDFDKPQSYVTDHFSPFSNLSDRHSFVATKDVIGNSPIISGDQLDPVVYEGIGHLLNPSNTLTIPILRASATSYSSNSSTTAGREILLVSAMQARNSARVSVSGSASLFSDKFFSLSRGNRAFAEELVDWTFQRRGVLRWSNVKHHKLNEVVSPYMYRVKDMIVFSIDIHELVNGFWVPYRGNDVQMEFTMLDPYIRAFLSPPASPESPTYSTIFKAPDRYGVFKFVVDYFRSGYNTLHMESLAPVRNFKHSDYPRFLPGASPYYTSAICSMIGVMIFSLVFLYHLDVSKPMEQLQCAPLSKGGSGAASAGGSVEQRKPSYLKDVMD